MTATRTRLRRRGGAVRLWRVRGGHSEGAAQSGTRPPTTRHDQWHPPKPRRSSSSPARSDDKPTRRWSARRSVTGSAMTETTNASRPSPPLRVCWPRGRPPVLPHPRSARNGRWSCTTLPASRLGCPPRTPSKRGRPGPLGWRQRRKRQSPHPILSLITGTDPLG